jgi:peptidoglycan hydrolase-like protein with peptidoglycan-binding domain
MTVETVTPNLAMTHDEWLADVRKPGPNGKIFFLDPVAVVPLAATNLIMEDDTATVLFTPGCGAYAGYANGSFANMPAVRAYAASQNAKAFAYTPYVASNADALDVEPGDATPADAPAGYRVGLRYFYGSASWISLIVSALSAAGFPRDQYKIISAHYVGPHICGPGTCGYPQADATQFADNYLGVSLDATAYPADFFGAVNPYPILPGASGALVVELQKSLNKWAKPIGLVLPLLPDGNFGSLTKAAVILAQEHFAEHGITAGNVTLSLFTKLQAALPVIVPPPPPPVYGPPLGLSVAPDATVTIAWSAPATVAGLTAAPTAYIVTVTDSTKKSIAGFPITLPGTQTSLNVSLPRGGAFAFSVTAKGANGIGKAASGSFTV